MKHLSDSIETAFGQSIQDPITYHNRNSFSYQEENEDGILLQGTIEQKFSHKDPATLQETIRSYQSYGANYYLHSNKVAQNKLANNYANLVMAGMYPLTSVSHQNALKSNGLLPGAEKANAMLTKNNEILFKWADNSGMNTAKGNDQVVIVTYFPLTRQIVYTLHAATRSGCEAFLPLDCRKGKVVETWIAFSSRDGKDTGDCVYAGRVCW